MPVTTTPPPTTIGSCVTLACIWEATAPKPGNVYRGADFDDLTYVDFLTSAAIVGPVLNDCRVTGVGASVLEAVTRTRAAVATNTNLGMLLLLAPLAAVEPEVSLVEGIESTLQSLDEHDAAAVFEAIRVAQPGGLGEVDEADVRDTSVPEMSLVDAMQLAADRDLIARQYVNGFEQVFDVAQSIEAGVSQGWALSEAIVHAFLRLLAEFPDSLIARKCGEQVAREVSAQAANVLSYGEPGDENYQDGLQAFDFALRTDGHRRNPGTSADVIAAALFVLLREDRLTWPIRFYRHAEP